MAAEFPPGMLTWGCSISEWVVFTKDFRSDLYVQFEVARGIPAIYHFDF